MLGECRPREGDLRPREGDRRPRDGDRWFLEFHIRINIGGKIVYKYFDYCDVQKIHNFLQGRIGIRFSGGSDLDPVFRIFFKNPETVLKRWIRISFLKGLIQIF